MSAGREIITPRLTNASAWRMPRSFEQLSWLKMTEAYLGLMRWTDSDHSLSTLRSVTGARPPPPIRRIATANSTTRTSCFLRGWEKHGVSSTRGS